MIALEDFCVSFGQAVALRNATLSLARGARLGVVGESGSGKTMLGLSLMGMVPDAARRSGTMTVDGVEMGSASEADWQKMRARRVAMVFQEPMAALNPLRRVGDTVMEPMRLHDGLSRARAQARAVSLFEEVGIPDPAARLRQFPHELSGGQRQRVLIALALACNPALLIADEPTTALDANVALRITDLLVRLSREREMALVFISHDLGAVSRATDTLVVMYGGDMVEQGPTAQVLAAPLHPYTKGLLAARPDPARSGRDASGKRRRLPTIPGTVPPLHALPAGCRFSGRCSVEITACALQRPALRWADATQAAACHLLTGGDA